MKIILNNAHLLEGASSSPIVIFAHGAGAGYTSPFMNDMAERLVKHGLQVFRFNFNYMEIAEQTGKRRPPNKVEDLANEFSEVVAAVAKAFPNVPIVLAGKSMGGRIATMIENKFDYISRVFCFGYPFHPPSKPEKLRTDHIASMKSEVVNFQGEKDKLGNRATVESLGLPAHWKIHWFLDGDHDLKPRKRSGFDYESYLEEMAQKIASDVIQ